MNLQWDGPCPLKCGDRIESPITDNRCVHHFQGEGIVVEVEETECPFSIPKIKSYATVEHLLGVSSK